MEFTTHNDLHQLYRNICVVNFMELDSFDLSDPREDDFDVHIPIGPPNFTWKLL